MRDLAAFRLTLAELIAQAQRAGIDAELLVHVADGARELTDEVQRRRYRSTPDQVRHLERLERQLADRTPSARVAAICERMRIKRSRYFELRKLVRLPDRTPARSNENTQPAHSANGTGK